MPTYKGERPNSPRGKMDSGELYLGSRSYTRELLVLADNLAQGPPTILQTAEIPRIFDPYLFDVPDVVGVSEEDDYALCRSLDCHRLQNNSLEWVVVAEYRTYSRAELLGEWEHPLLTPPEIEVTNEKFQEAVEFAIDPATGEISPCRNSAGQVFDPPPMRDRSRLVLSITRNEEIAAQHPSIDVAYVDRLNADTFWGCAPGTWKCMGVSTQRQVRQMQDATIYPYLRCTYRFEARPYWTAKLLDAGRYYKDANGNKLPFQLRSGEPELGLLDGRGGRLADAAAPVFLEFVIYDSVPFAGLQLPQQFFTDAFTTPRNFRPNGQ